MLTTFSAVFDYVCARLLFPESAEHQQRTRSSFKKKEDGEVFVPDFPTKTHSVPPIQVHLCRIETSTRAITKPNHKNQINENESEK